MWELVDSPDGYQSVGCKWMFKTKRDTNGNVDRYKTRLVVKGFTQQSCIDFAETFFSLVSSKVAFHIIIDLVAHYDLELHHIDVKTAFLNGAR